MAPPGNHEAGSRGKGRSSSGSDCEHGPTEIELGAFCAEAVDALVAAGQADAEAAVAEAVRAYLDGVEGKPEWEVPAAMPGFEAVETKLTVPLELGSGGAERLDAEAARQGVDAERLVEQALIVAYAELDRRRS
jgi:hypothetical protein